MASGSGSAPGKEGLGAVRRQWDKEVFEQRARDRVERELEEERQAALAKAPPRVVIQRAPLDRSKARAEQNLDLKGAVGQKKVVNLKKPEQHTSPFFCTVCNCELRDSANWLAHLNGKNHVRNLGMNMRAERSTLDAVKAKLTSTTQRPKAEMTKNEEAAAFRDEFDRRVKEQEERERLERQQRRAQEKKQAKEATGEAEEEAPPIDPDMAAMGFNFAGFGSSKQS